jgi:hypothetical protein
MSPTIAEVDAHLPVITSQSFKETIGLLPQRLAAAIAGAVGAVEVLLSALGLTVGGVSGRATSA